MTGAWPPTPTAVMTAVTPGEERPLKAVLARLRDAPWFDRLDETHFAKLVVLGQVPVVPGFPAAKHPLRMRYLLFTALTNLPEEAFFEELRVRCGEHVDEVWAHCVGYPGHEEARRFHTYMSKNSLRPSQTFTSYDATVSQVRAALDLRKRHIDFALKGRGMDPGRLRRAFREHFDLGGGASDSSG